LFCGSTNEKKMLSRPQEIEDGDEYDHWIIDCTNGTNADCFTGYSNNISTEALPSTVRQIWTTTVWG